MATGIAETLRDASRLLAEAADQLHEPLPSLEGFELAYVERAGKTLCVWVRDRRDPDRRVARLAANACRERGPWIDLSDREWDELVPASE